MQDTRTYLDNDGVCSKVKWSCIVSIGEVRVHVLIEEYLCFDKEFLVCLLLQL